MCIASQISVIIFSETNKSFPTSILSFKSFSHLSFCKAFILFFFYLLIFVARKYIGFWYVFPIFPFLILTGSITLIELINTRYLNWNRNTRGKIIISILGAVTLIGAFSSATARVSQIGENLRNSPIQGAQEI